MIVCSCNLITDKDIAVAMTLPKPPCCVREVYESLGCSPVCGGCALMIHKLMQIPKKTAAAVEREREIVEMDAA